MRSLPLATCAVIAFALAAAGPAGAAGGTAPGAPGAEAVWGEADKDGFGTSTTRASKVWHTLDDGILSEVWLNLIEAYGL